MTFAARQITEKKTVGHLSQRVSTEYDFDAVALFVFSLVIFDRLSAGFPSRDARPASFFLLGGP
ncbi:hypothetical protein GCM10010937_24060 [Gluconobacter japonicus]|uniref:Uncharacterized protein n=1 Tax=Gluconobacter japonicus TaxID=376620 RepID=A0ABQ5WLF2_GLUJA|nr:hypothetical protein AD938_12705 [Gluconobacter japonicus]GLQ60603.1 hypothetical protein GCM10010937_24060 [Gluconobacter japonicus]